MTIASLSLSTREIIPETKRGRGEEEEMRRGVGERGGGEWRGRGERRGGKGEIRTGKVREERGRKGAIREGEKKGEGSDREKTMWSEMALARTHR